MSKVTFNDFNSFIKELNAQGLGERATRIENQAEVNYIPTDETFILGDAEISGEVPEKGEQDFRHARVKVYKAAGTKDAPQKGAYLGSCSFRAIVGNTTELDENYNFIPVTVTNTGSKFAGKTIAKSGKKFNPAITEKTIFNWFNKPMIAEAVEYETSKKFAYENVEELIEASKDKAHKTGYKIKVK